MKGCSFGESLGLKCNLVSDPGGYCPRHAAIIGALGGIEKALSAEFGVACSCCDRRVDETSISDCSICEAVQACPKCLEKRLCCVERLKQLDEEVESSHEDYLAAKDVRDALKEALDKAKRTKAA